MPSDPDLFDEAERRADEAPDRRLYGFLDDEGREVESLTREAFLERARMLAGWLCSAPGYAPGERVILAFPPGLEMISAFFACVRAGLVPVPTAAPAQAGLDVSLRRMAHIARDCRPIAALTAGAAAALLAARPPMANAEDEATLAALPRIETDRVRTAAPAPPRAARSPILFLQYTSGSTSDPKGVIVSHANVLANARLTVDHADAVGVSWLPQHHDMGLIGYWLNAATAGAELVGFSPAAFVQRPMLWLQLLSRRRATATSAPNFALEHCLRRGLAAPGACDGLDLGGLRFLMVASEPAKPDVLRRFQQALAPAGLRPEALMAAYGLAENTLAVSSYGRRSLSVNRNELAAGRVRLTRRVAEVDAARRLMSCGRPLGENRVAIVDPETGRPRPEGAVGEIWVTGPSRCLGYWGDPEATDATFRARLADEPETEFLRTGDMGFLHEGELFVCGRLKDMIIVRGRNHFPQDIEAAVESLPGVRPGGVVAFDADEGGDARVTVVVERKGARGPDARALAAAVRRSVGVALDEVVFAPPRSIPRTSSGKVSRFLARRMLADGRLRALERTRLDLDAGVSAGADGASAGLAALLARYGLTGRETGTLADAGVDSLDHVLFLHELAEIAASAGVATPDAEIDMRLAQDLTVAELVSLARRLADHPAAGAAQLRRIAASRGEASRAAERALMRADLALDGRPERAAAAAGRAAERILLTGPTGSLGPFLVASLLEQTSAQVVALARGESAEAAKARIRAGLAAVVPMSAALREAFERRVTVVVGDLERPSFGLGPGQWTTLAEEADAILHNAAMVNYLWTYGRMRAANVLGTREVLRLAFEGRPKTVDHVSTTFIFGWSGKPVLREDDDNAAMELLDFGYSQSKWVSEQLMLEARRRGLATRIFRPALISPSVDGAAAGFDISLRLLAFMIKHGIGPKAENQISLLPADVAAANIVAIAGRPETAGGVFHVTRDGHAAMPDVLDVVARLTGRRFELFELADFVPEVIRRCTVEDPLFPLLDFLVGSIDRITAMQFKRYDNARYRAARASSPGARPEPSLEDTVRGILRYLRRSGLAEAGLG